MKTRPRYIRILEQAGISPEATRTMTDTELRKYRRMGTKALAELRRDVPIDPTLAPSWFNPISGEGFESAVYEALLPMIVKFRNKGKSHARLAAKIVASLILHE